MTATVAGPAAAARPVAAQDSVVPHGDVVPRRLALVATIVSFAAFFWFQHKGQILQYEDSISHMEIARRVIDSPTTGYGQFGGVWLLLPHLLMVPFIWYNPFYYSGFAGSIISMAAYVVCSVLLYKIVFHLTGKKSAGIIGALVFMANPNVLYMQSTPMTELLLFACMAGMVYGVQRWIQTDKPWPYLALAGFAGFLGVISRYEAWVLFAALEGVVIYAAWRKKYTYQQIKGLALAFFFVPVASIGLWLVYCQVTFGNALYWEDGPYAKPSLWVARNELAIGHWSIASKIYAYAISDNLLYPGVALALLGFVLIVVRERLKPAVLPVLSLLTMIPFFVYSLESGQRPLHVMQVNGALYNVRFGLLMILPASIFIGYLAGMFERRWLRIPMLSVVIAAITYSALQVPARHIVTETEPRAFVHEQTVKEFDAAGSFMRKHYDRGVVLAQFFGNEEVLFKARINLVNNLYEGSYQRWQPALADPVTSKVRWIIMRSETTDQVYAALHGKAVLRANYHLVFDADHYEIYERS